MKFMTSDDIKLDYTDEGNGQPIVILTGFGGSKEIWQAQVPVLVANGYRVINLDGRGQGLSEHTSKGLRMSRRAMDAYELIHSLKLEQPILLGNSMGAATWFAYLSLFGDQAVRAVIDVDQSPKMINTMDWPYGFKDVTWSDFPAYFEYPLGSSTYKHIDNTTYAAVKEIAKQAPFNEKQMVPLLINHAFQDWRDVIAGLKIPLLIIAGQKSPYFNCEFASITAQTAINGHSVVIPEAGHIVMAEQSVAFNQALLHFLNTLN